MKKLDCYEDTYKKIPIISSIITIILRHPYCKTSHKKFWEYPETFLFCSFGDINFLLQSNLSKSTFNWIWGQALDSVENLLRGIKDADILIFNLNLSSISSRLLQIPTQTLACFFFILLQSTFSKLTFSSFFGKVICQGLCF